MGRIGRQTITLDNPPVIQAFAAVAGKKEGEGPLSDSFDLVFQDSFFGQETWEKAESAMLNRALALALGKAGLDYKDVDCVFSGDLLNQCAGSAFGIRGTDIPFFGLYGACSTMAESLALASMTVSAGYANNAAAVTGSHFCSAERQFRMPLEYGGQRTPTAQWTVTGAGCAVLSRQGAGPKITCVTPGRIVDLGIKDLSNMGAAMAPAAFDTLYSHFSDTGRAPDYYDLILTGDLGLVGSGILRDMFYREGVNISGIHNDCGLMIFDREKQDAHAGGSGCGCSASVLCGEIMRKMRQGGLKKVLFAATGALMSPVTSMQGESIPGICCAVSIEGE
ncbi:MAG: stage V sporulation protein AD [Oscillospiraceae bacterium]|nr:stage V sporulation protein AD [Oscillospiraceae bacterium]